MTTIYGIKNCDTMKKAMNWLDEHRIEYAFHDYKKAGISRSTLKAWAALAGWETLLNTRGTTWRKLSETERATPTESKAIDLMEQHPSLIKRPVLDHGGTLLVGFKPDEYDQLLRK